MQDDDGPDEKLPHRTYQQLGAPALVFRNREAHESVFETVAAKSWRHPKDRYFSKDMPINLAHNEINRVKARWYYPLDMHICKSRVPIRKADLALLAEDAEQADAADNNDDEAHSSANVAHTESQDAVPAAEASILADANIDTRKIHDINDARGKHEADKFLQMSRLFMMLEAEKNIHEATKTLLDHHMYDAPYMAAPKSKRLRTDYPNEAAAIRRRNLSSDPTYLAPIGRTSIRAAIDEGQTKAYGSGKLQEDDIGANPYVTNDVNNEPIRYGNSVLCLPCPCHSCGRKVQSSRQTWYLIHPCAEFLHKVTLSKLRFHEDPTIDGEDSNSSTRSQRVLLDVGDTVQEIKQGGNWAIDGISNGIIVVRTCNHVSLVQIRCIPTIHNNNSDVGNADTGNCTAQYYLVETQRIDLRSMSSSFDSYLPVSITAHPKYGNAFSDPKIAIACKSSRGECNVIHHINAGAPLLPTKHTIRNLKLVSLIDFSQLNPMCLWSAAKSYVNPTLATSSVSKRAMYGEGSSLYHIDLRTDKGCFQWSPSAEEMITEGATSISGIHTDWRRDHSLWVSSTDAGKVWELDCRMPCKAMTSWSLASACDDYHTKIPANGIRGDGMLFTPIAPAFSRDATNSLLKSTILAVNKSPHAFGLHMYQCPQARPRFQTDPIEMVSSPYLSNLKTSSSIATTSVYPLPEKSDGVFTCGIAAFTTPIGRILPSESLERLQLSQTTSVICAISLTNRGDVSCHLLSDAANIWEMRKDFDGIVLGSKPVAIPHVEDLQITNSATDNNCNLSLSFSNVYPPPASPSLAVKQNVTNRMSIDVTRLFEEHDDDTPAILPTSEHSVAKQDVNDEAKSSNEAAFPSLSDMIYINYDAESVKSAQTTESKGGDRADLIENRERIYSSSKSVVESDDREDETNLRSDISASLISSSMGLWDELG